MAFISKSSLKSQQAPTAESERDRWIHRDKLTQIEIQEYRELGLEPPAELLRRAAESRQRAANSEQAEALRKIRSPSPYRYDENEEEDEDGHGHQGAHGRSHFLDADDDDDDDNSIFVPVDPRSPEEIAADPYEDGRMTPLLRKSNSKIPLAPYSPAPVPQEHLDREQRLPRKRNGSSVERDIYGTPNSNLAYPRTRPRKDSSGSGGIVPEDEIPIASSPIGGGPLTPSSPNKQRTPQTRSASGKSIPKVRNTSTQRGVSGTRAHQRTTSTASRPGTSSGERPRTATHPPEGDPPWLETMNMYKPDPRLPPDQQLLPTHAKKLAREQMERDGKSGQMYDRDLNAMQFFSLEDEMEYEKARLGAGEELDQERQVAAASPSIGDRAARWPLSGDFSPRDPTPSPRKTSDRSANGSPNKSKDAGSTGGYSTMPRLTDSPKPQIGLFPSPRIGGETPDPGRHQSPRPQQQPMVANPTPANPPPSMGLQTRVTGGTEENNEKEAKKKKGGCGCCIVM